MTCQTTLSDKINLIDDLSPRLKQEMLNFLYYTQSGLAKLESLRLYRQVMLTEHSKEIEEFWEKRSNETEP